jgi:hypothetical protein
MSIAVWRRILKRFRTAALAILAACNYKFKNNREYKYNYWFYPLA